jgi:hypothetical protein
MPKELLTRYKLACDQENDPQRFRLPERIRQPFGLRPMRASVFVQTGSLNARLHAALPPADRLADAWAAGARLVYPVLHESVV